VLASAPQLPRLPCQYQKKVSSEDLRNLLVRLLDPRVSFDFHEVILDGIRFAIPEVDRANGQPVKFWGAQLFLASWEIHATTLLETLRRWVPEIALSDEDFESGHRMEQVILLLHLPVIVTVAVVLGHAEVHLTWFSQHHHSMSGMSETTSAVLIWSMIAGVVVCSVLSAAPGAGGWRDFVGCGSDSGGGDPD
jgi:hypothetical protein